MAKTLQFVVEVPDIGITKTEWKAHIKDAVESWGGQFHPDNPLFNFGDAKVTTLKPRSSSNE